MTHCPRSTSSTGRLPRTRGRGQTKRVSVSIHAAEGLDVGVRLLFKLAGDAPRAVHGPSDRGGACLCADGAVLMAWKTRWYPTGAKRTPRLRYGPTRCIAGGAGRGRLDVKGDATPNGNPLQRHSDCIGRGDVGSCKDSSAGTFVPGPTRTYVIAVIGGRPVRSACVRWWVSVWCCATLTGAKRRL